jgi:hypothetical protein
MNSMERRIAGDHVIRVTAAGRTLWPDRRTLDAYSKEQTMRFFGRDKQAEQPSSAPTDEQAVARYRYMLATAPPDEIERAHEEAFARLTPEQRRQALQALAQHVPESEIRGDDPASLARAATRAEIRRPGTIERAWGGSGAGLGLGGMFLTMMAGSFIGTAVAQSFFDNDRGFDGSTGDGGDGDGGASDAGADDPGSDGGMADSGDFGGDMGGGDMGGGDFGGGDFGGF